ncbi:hypothetical protein D8674_004311 [Pyrus ussuriensis x Pyrus communis]|uniref:Uncharacterized protein n=1 Tax=Pyrus ussuriensis x Pyrus communis TaxID=2448454 RepID=A0A5N5FJJ3_9ROSA|nr:hypothetical protein D8674_004311 [Pyrus ussuriensis x Pyrus communis]
MTSLLFQGTNDLPVEPTQPQRGASLTRFREKRKKRCFDMKICYTQVRVSAVIIDLKDESINGERKKVNLHHPRLVLMMNVVSIIWKRVIEFESPASSGATQGSVQDESIQETLHDRRQEVVKSLAFHQSGSQVAIWEGLEHSEVSSVVLLISFPSSLVQM